jgi:hypothetical protein
MDRGRGGAVGLSDEDVTDEELERLAMAADPLAPLDPEATAWRPELDGGLQLLPSWYMPLPRTRAAGGRWPVALAAVVVVGFLLIDACGLCITSGFLSWA